MLFAVGLAKTALSAARPGYYYMSGHSAIPSSEAPIRDGPWIKVQLLLLLSLILALVAFTAAVFICFTWAAAIVWLSYSLDDLYAAAVISMAAPS